MKICNHTVIARYHDKGPPFIIGDTGSHLYDHVCMCFILSDTGTLCRTLALYARTFLKHPPLTPILNLFCARMDGIQTFHNLLRVKIVLQICIGDIVREVPHHGLHSTVGFEPGGISLSCVRWCKAIAKYFFAELRHQILSRCILQLCKPAEMV